MPKGQVHTSVGVGHAAHDTLPWPFGTQQHQPGATWAVDCDDGVGLAGATGLAGSRTTAGAARARCAFLAGLRAYTPAVERSPWAQLAPKEMPPQQPRVLAGTLLMLALTVAGPAPAQPTCPADVFRHSLPHEGSSPHLSGTGVGGGRLRGLVMLGETAFRMRAGAAAPGTVSSCAAVWA